MDDSTRYRPPRNSPHRIWRIPVILAASVLLVASAGLVAARQAARLDQSPATGHAQVVTQGIAMLPGEPVVWRLVERTAQPRGSAQFGDRVLGFVLATDEPVLLTDETAGGMVDVARVAPGEAYLVKPGTRQARSSLTGQPTTYLSLELVPAAVADQVGNGVLLHQTDPFIPATGQRDVDLVRDVLALQEGTFIPDSGQPVAIFASEGAVDVVPSIGKPRTLQPGDVGIFEGEITVTAVPAAAANASRAPLAAFTQSHQVNQSAPGAAFVAAVIGPEIPPAPTPTPAAEPPIEQAPMSTPALDATATSRPPEPTTEVTPTTEPTLNTEPTTRPPIVVIPTFGPILTLPTPSPTFEPVP